MLSELRNLSQAPKDGTKVPPFDGGVFSTGMGNINPQAIPGNTPQSSFGILHFHESALLLREVEAERAR
jgi:hypothetical protein